MKLYRVNEEFIAGGTTFKRGEEIEMEDAEGDELVKQNILEVIQDQLPTNQ